MPEWSIVAVLVVCIVGAAVLHSRTGPQAARRLAGERGAAEAVAESLDPPVDAPGLAPPPAVRWAWGAMRWVFLLAALALMATFAARTVALAVIAGWSTRVEGTVVHHTSESYTCPDPNGKGRVYAGQSDVAPVVRYRSPEDGRPRRFVSRLRLGQLPPAYAVGTRVPVLVSALSPETAELAGARVFVRPAGLLLVGYFAALIVLLGWNVLERTGSPPWLFRLLFPPAWTLRGAALALAMAAALVGAAWCAVRATPWARPLWVAFRERRSAPALLDDLARTGPPAASGFNAAQRAVLRLPMVGERLAREAVAACLTQRRTEALRSLLAALGADGLGIDLAGWRPFTRAVEARDPAAVRVLAAAGLDPRRDATALDQAIAGDHAELVQALLEAGAAPRPEDLERALQAGAAHALDALLERGRIDVTGSDAEGRSLADRALLEGLPQAARALRARGAPATLPPLVWAAADGDAEALAREVPEARWPATRAGGVGLLELAARSGQLALVERMLAQAAAFGWRACDEALQGAAARGHVAVVRRLAALNEGLCAAALRVAVEARRWECARAIVAAGESQRPLSDTDRVLLGDALFAAAEGGSAETARFLLEHGADPNQPRGEGYVALERAANDEVAAVLAPVTRL